MKNILIILGLALLIVNCAGVKETEVFKSNVKLEDNEFNADLETIISELRPIMKWLKWDIAYTNSNNGLVILKEAYVYRKNNKLLRIYHFPDKEYLNNSRISDYLKKVSKLKYGFLHSSVSFTQETMRIQLTETDESIVRLDIEYLIRTYDTEQKNVHEAQSNGYIEELILDKLRERLSNSGPRR